MRDGSLRQGRGPHGETIRGPKESGGAPHPETAAGNVDRLRRRIRQLEKALKNLEEALEDARLERDVAQAAGRSAEEQLRWSKKAAADYRKELEILKASIQPPAMPAELIGIDGDGI